MFNDICVNRKGIRPPVHTLCYVVVCIALGNNIFKNIGSIYKRQQEHIICFSLLTCAKTPRKSFLGTWISLIMIAASWWLDIRLPAYSTVLPSATWIHSVLLLCTTSLRKGPLWAIDSGLFKWAEASSSPHSFSRGCRHLILFGNFSMLTMQPREFTVSDHIRISLSVQPLVSK